MVLNKRKKKTRMRGTKSHGWGDSKKHRGSGSRGGVGKAGRKKFKKTWVTTHEPDYFGKRGFKKPVNSTTEIKAINLKDLDRMAIKMNKKEINLSEIGFHKVLSTGKLTQPLVIKANKIVERAKQKIEEAGGKAIENV